MAVHSTISDAGHWWPRVSTRSSMASGWTQTPRRTHRPRRPQRDQCHQRPGRGLPRQPARAGPLRDPVGPRIGSGQTPGQVPSDNTQAARAATGALREAGRRADGVRHRLLLHWHIPTVMQAGGRVIVADDAPELIEGSWHGKRTVVVEFDSVEARGTGTGRGIKDVLFCSCDGLPGLPEAIEAAWPRAIVQTCVIHLIRASMRYVAHDQRKKAAAAMRPIYTAVNEAAARAALEDLRRDFGKKNPAWSPPGNAPGTPSSRSCSSTRLSARSSTPPTRSSRSTSSSARSSRTGVTSPMTTPPSSCSTSASATSPAATSTATAWSANAASAAPAPSAGNAALNALAVHFGDRVSLRLHHELRTVTATKENQLPQLTQKT